MNMKSGSEVKYYKVRFMLGGFPNAIRIPDYVMDHLRKTMKGLTDKQIAKWYIKNRGYRGEMITVLEVLTDDRN